MDPKPNLNPSIWDGPLTPPLFTQRAGALFLSLCLGLGGVFAFATPSRTALSCPPAPVTLQGTAAHPVPTPAPTADAAPAAPSAPRPLS